MSARERLRALKASASTLELELLRLAQVGERAVIRGAPPTDEDLAAAEQAVEGLRVGVELLRRVWTLRAGVEPPALRVIEGGGA